MSINAPCSCIKMFYSVTTKQAEIRDHTQMSHQQESEVDLSKKGKTESSAAGFKVLIIFAALTVSGFVTKNDVKSYKFDILIVRCTVSHLCGLSELTLTQVHTMKLLKKGKMEKFEAG